MSSYSKGFRDAWAESVSDVERLTADNDNLRTRADRAETDANRLLMEKDQWHDSARVAEAELARVRPVVDAAEALVEHPAVEMFTGLVEPLRLLVAAVQEAQK